MPFSAVYSEMYFPESRRAIDILKRSTIPIIIAFLIMPVIISLLYVHFYGVDVLIYDEWFFVPLFDKLHKGTLAIGDFMQPLNEHRHFFVIALMVYLGNLTDWNIHLLMYITWFLFSLIAGILFLSHIREWGLSQSALARFIPIPWLILGLRHTENLLCGCGLAQATAIFFSLLAFYLLDANKKLGAVFSLSVLSGAVASFSHGAGLFVWPSGLVQIYFLWKLGVIESKSNFYKIAGAWILSGAAVAFLYLFDGELSRHSGTMGLFENPALVLHYLILIAGSPMSVNEGFALVAGAIFWISVIWVGVTITRHIPNCKSAVWLSLIVYSVLISGVIAVTRVKLGLEFALSSRYATLNTLGTIGLYNAFLILMFKRKGGQSAFANTALYVVVALISISLIHTYSWGQHMGEVKKEVRLRAAYHLSSMDFQSNEMLSERFLNPLYFKSRAEFKKSVELLKKYKLNIFREEKLDPAKLFPSPLPGQYSIDVINDKPFAPRVTISAEQKTITMLGWAVDGEAQRAAGDLFVNINGEIDIPVMYGYERKDVAEYFKIPGYLNSGFWASFAPFVLKPGENTVSLKVVSSDKKRFYAASQKFIMEVKR